MSIRRFEDLEIWQEARVLCKKVFEITSNGPFSVDFKFRDQIRAAAGSAMDNIAEGFDRRGNKEFSQFLSISSGSTGEVRSQLYRAFDYNYITDDKLNEMLDRTESLSRKTYNLIKHIKSSDIQGLKYS